MMNEPPPGASTEPPPDTGGEPLPEIGTESIPAAGSTAPAITSVPALEATSSGNPPAISGQAPPLPPRPRSRAPLLIRLSVEGLLGIVLVSFLVFTAIDQREHANQQLASQLAAQKAALADQQSQIDALQAEVADLKSRWFGSPALFSPPAIANTDIIFFDVTGTNQKQLLDSFMNASICTTYGPCAPDPAVPNGYAMGLEGFKPTASSYQCYSPSTTTLEFREFVVLPRWSAPTDGTIRIPLVEAWNALAQTIYTHELGHVAIDRQGIAALNDQAHQLPNCTSLISFWASPSVYDTINADQAAYHARLHADCRPEIGCFVPGWMGW
jgi:hypothetical protein